VHDIMHAQGFAFPIVKAGGDTDDPLIQAGQIAFELNSAAVASQLGSGPILVGGTAWLFSRPELFAVFD
jgi:hypothetical protein